MGRQQLNIYFSSVHNGQENASGTVAMCSGAVIENLVEFLISSGHLPLPYMGTD